MSDDKFTQNAGEAFATAVQKTAEPSATVHSFNAAVVAQSPPRNEAGMTRAAGLGRLKKSFRID